MAPMQQIIKTYPPRGPLQQFRRDSAVAFHCFRCGLDKKAKLVTVYQENWDTLLCNGCYGYLLSVYDVKAGADSDEDKAASLADLLLNSLSQEQTRQAVEKLRMREKRATFLSERAEQFIATSEHVAQSLYKAPGLDWSPAIIGLCKAVELELVRRLIEPLKSLAENAELIKDTRDNDLRKVARYCAGQTTIPPELGTIRYFLKVAGIRRDRLDDSNLLRCLRNLFSDWPRASWFVETDGALEKLEVLASNFRNRAAHTDELAKSDYDSCRALVIGEDGVLWSILASSVRRN